MSELKVANVAFAYEKQKNIIEDISIELHDNEIVCLLGTSGGGKTTLFNVIAGLLVPDQGAYSWMGKTFPESRDILVICCRKICCFRIRQSRIMWRCHCL